MSSQSLLATSGTDDAHLQNEKTKSATDGPQIKTLSSVNYVQDCKKSKVVETKRRGSSGSSRRKRYETDRV